MSFTEEQIAQLDAPLSSAAVKQREQAGRKFSYIEGWHVIAEANRIFGFDAWARETVEIRLVAEKERKVGKGQYERDGWGVSYIARVRVTVGLGDAMEPVIREGVGAGHGIDADQGLAHESAIKEAETDAMKRALMTFGNPFGLALYDKAQEGVEKAPSGGQRNGATSRPEPSQSQQSASAVRVADNAADAKADGLIAQISGIKTGADLDWLKNDADTNTLYERLSLSNKARVKQAFAMKAQSFAAPIGAG